MLVLCADNLATPIKVCDTYVNMVVCLSFNAILKVQLRETGPTLVKEAGAFFLTMLRALAQRLDSLTVQIMVSEFTTASILKMLESHVSPLEPLPHHVSCKYQQACS